MKKSFAAAHPSAYVASLNSWQQRCLQALRKAALFHIDLVVSIRRPFKRRGRGAPSRRSTLHLQKDSP